MTGKDTGTTRIATGRRRKRLVVVAALGCGALALIALQSNVFEIFRADVNRGTVNQMPEASKTVADEEKPTEQWPAVKHPREHVAETYHDNGAKKERYVLLKLVDGRTVRNGNWTYWDARSRRLIEGEYSSGLRSGRWTWWYESGAKKQACGFGKDKFDGAFARWDEGGQLVEQGHMSAGNRNGEWRSWHANGKLKAVEQYRAGALDGPLLHYHESGGISEETQYEAGKETGKKTFYHLNGKRAEQGQVVDGMLHGLWTFWNGDGTKSKEVRYAQGRIAGEVE